MIEVLLTEQDPARVLLAVATIVGQTLGVDRSLIYEVREDEGVVLAETEWLNPAEPRAISSGGTYPIGMFSRAASDARRTAAPIVSHRDEPHPILVQDGSAAFLHEQLAIHSLLWFPFEFTEHGFRVLVFNQVSHRRVWSSEELEFVSTVTRHVELALLQNRLRAERSEAKRALFESQKEETISVLAAGVAHDFNNLIGVVLASVGRLRRQRELPSEYKESLARTEAAAREAAELARSLQAYAGGGQSLIMEVDMAALVQELRELLRSAAGVVPVRFALEGPAYVQGDAGQLRQVLFNFVINAAEAGASAIEVSVHSDGEQVVLRVVDDGAGVPESSRRKIFEPFYSTKTKGRGLGLAVVAGIARGHNAELSVEGRAEGGTGFTLALPAIEPRAPVKPPVRERVLMLIDDNENFRRMCSSLLKELGFCVIDTNSGTEAREWLSTKHIDLAMVDWRMPEPSGRETFAALRSQEPSLPILLTSGITEESVTEILAGPQVAFLEKPFTVEQLEAVLGQLLKP